MTTKPVLDDDRAEEAFALAPRRRRSRARRSGSQADCSRIIGPEFGPSSRCPVATSIVSLSEFKARAAQMLSEMKTTEHAIVLTQRGAASAVVRDFHSHQRLQDALVMLKLMVQGETDVAAGRTTPRARVFEDLEARLSGAPAG